MNLENVDIELKFQFLEENTIYMIYLIPAIGSSKFPDLMDDFNIISIES